MIDVDIYNRIIEFKAKNETIKINRIAVMLTTEYGQTNTLMSTMLMTKIALDM